MRKSVCRTIICIKILVDIQGFLDPNKIIINFCTTSAVQGPIMKTFNYRCREMSVHFSLLLVFNSILNIGVWFFSHKVWYKFICLESNLICRHPEKMNEAPDYYRFLRNLNFSTICRDLTTRIWFWKTKIRPKKH